MPVDDKDDEQKQKSDPKIFLGNLTLLLWYFPPISVACDYPDNGAMLYHPGSHRYGFYLLGRRQEEDVLRQPQDFLGLFNHQNINMRLPSLSV